MNEFKSHKTIIHFNIYRWMISFLVIRSNFLAKSIDILSLNRGGFQIKNKSAILFSIEYFFREPTNAELKKTCNSLNKKIRFKSREV